MKKLLAISLAAILTASPAFAFGHGGGGHGGHFGGGGFHGGFGRGHFAGRSVGHGFHGRGLGWGGAALGLGAGAIYGASQCYAWNGWTWVYVCGYPGW
jgi:hypothetical protein